jgi:hypothetical protein
VLVLLPIGAELGEAAAVAGKGRTQQGFFYSFFLFVKNACVYYIPIRIYI